MEPKELTKQLHDWARSHADVFQVHAVADGVRLTEIETGKTLQIAADQVLQIDSKQNWNTGASYLLLALQSLPPLALADAGFVFGLDTRNTGDLHGAPATMSFRDFRRLHRHLQHLLEQQAQPDHRREALDVTMILIASLDGARALGIPTTAEEADLEKAIRQLEAGA